MRHEINTNLYRILRDADIFEKRLHKRVEGRYLITTRRIVVWLTFFLMVTTWPCAKFFGVDAIETGLWFILEIYFLFIIYALTLFLLSWKYIKGAIFSSLNVFSSNVRISLIVDTRTLSRLMKIPTAQLQLLLLEMKAEKESLKKRLILICGPLEKIGFLPGILSSLYILAAPKVQELEWIFALPYSLFALNVIHFAYSFFLMRLDRKVGLVEFAIARESSG